MRLTEEKMCSYVANRGRGKVVSFSWCCCNRGRRKIVVSFSIVAGNRWEKRNCCIVCCCNRSGRREIVVSFLLCAVVIVREEEEIVVSFSIVCCCNRSGKTGNCCFFSIVCCCNRSGRREIAFSFFPLCAPFVFAPRLLVPYYFVFLSAVYCKNIVTTTPPISQEIQFFITTEYSIVLHSNI